jgi:hypothetical protein
MLTRFHKILLGALAVQIALAVLLFARGGETTVKKEQPLLPGFDAAKVTRVQVLAAGEAQAVDLVKKGGGWVLASSYDYPADASKVDALLAPIAKLAAAEPVATQAARHKQLKVADGEFERKLTITANGKDTTLFVGAQAGLRRTAVRLAGSDDVYGVSGLSPYSAPAEPHMWVDQHYVMLPKDQIAKVTVKRADATLELSHADDGKWTATVDGGPVDPVDSDAIDHLVDQVAAIDLLAPADPKRDASKPTATIGVELKTKPGTSTAPILIDAIADGDKVWVHQRALDRAVVVDKSRMELTTIDRAKLVKAPAPAAPEAPK